MQRRYVTVDVFTDRAFGGNQLAVVLDAGALTTAQMQSIATEFNYSETTFVLPPRDKANDAEVRIFTPVRELPFAGHPNVGTAFVLASLAGEPKPDSKAAEKRAVSAAVEEVAEALGNTPAISRKSYVHPKLIEAARDRPRNPLNGFERPRRRKWLSSEEVGLLKFLTKPPRNSSGANA